MTTRSVPLSRPSPFGSNGSPSRFHVLHAAFRSPSPARDGLEREASLPSDAEPSHPPFEAEGAVPALPAEPRIIEPYESSLVLDANTRADAGVEGYDDRRDNDETVGMSPSKGCAASPIGASPPASAAEVRTLRCPCFTSRMARRALELEIPVSVPYSPLFDGEIPSLAPGTWMPCKRSMTNRGIW